MAKVVTADTGANTLTISASCWAALANVAQIVTPGVANTVIENLAAKYIAMGLRHDKDDRLGHGQATTAGLTHSYIETTVKGNSE